MCMRSKRNRSKNIKLAIVVLGVAVLIYSFGFTQGQQSIYKKAKNDHELLEMYGKK